MTITKDQEVEIIHRNLISMLSIIAADIDRMLKDKTDATLGLVSGARRLFESDISNLKRNLNTVKTVTAQVQSRNLSADALMSVMCDCPIHIRHLDDARIFTLSELLSSEEKALSGALYKAEAENAERQYHLHLVASYKRNRIANRFLL